jgi:WS/DGAT/MGAT family acyltransferase
MKQLSGIDAAFLNLEMQRTPMHIGGVYIFEGQTPQGAFDFERFREHMRNRLTVSPVFRRRLLEVPLNLDHPYWVEDADFDVDLHLQHIGLPKPGSMHELMALAGQLFARPLDRSRPLWEITFVEGLRAGEGVPAGAVALIAKVHHAAVDGISGEEIMAALLDLTPEPRMVTAEQSWLPDGIPNPVQLLLHGVKTTLRSPPRGVALLRTLGNTLGKSFRERILSNSTLPPALFSAPYTITNGAVSTRRVFGAAQLPLARINTIRNALPGTTMNDVVLTLCSGALRRYLHEREILPDESLVAMAPISVRKRHEQKAGGNRIFAMLVALATQEPDPLRRLEQVRASVRTSLQYKKAKEAARLAEDLPAAAVSLATRWYIRNQISQKHRPWFNVIITNVPGPSRPLYMAGAKLVSQSGSGPIIDGVGLIIVITSYAGTVGLGLTSCKEIFPDIEQLARHLRTALDELETAVVGAAPRPATLPAPEPAAALDEGRLRLENGVLPV